MIPSCDVLFPQKYFVKYLEAVFMRDFMAIKVTENAVRSVNKTHFIFFSFIGEI